MNSRICQKCFDGVIGSCACTVPKRAWEPAKNQSEGHRFTVSAPKKPPRAA